MLHVARGDKGDEVIMPLEYTDITNILEIKPKALEKHESRLKLMRDHDGIDFLDFDRTVSKFRGQQGGMKYVEGYRLCKCRPRIITKRLLP